MARNRATSRSRGARRAPRVGIASGGRRFNTPARVAFLHAANDNRPRGRHRLWGTAAACGIAAALLAALLLL